MGAENRQSKYLLAAFVLVACVAQLPAFPSMPLAFLFDDPEDDRQEAINQAGAWSASEVTSINRPGFSLQYPSHWKVATHQGDYNPDRLFTIETPGGSHVVIEIFNAPPGTNLSSLLADVLPALDGPAVETYSYGDFNAWGNFQGKGQHLKGKIMSIIPGGCRVFAALVPGKSQGLLITEFYLSEDLPDAMPGFDLISRTLVFK